MEPNTSYLIFLATSAGLDEGGLQDCSTEILHFILYTIQSQHSQPIASNSKENLGISPQVINEFHQVLRRDFPLDRVPIVLKPFIYQSSSDLQTLLTDIETLSVMANAMV